MSKKYYFNHKLNYFEEYKEKFNLLDFLRTHFLKKQWLLIFGGIILISLILIKIFKTSKINNIEHENKELVDNYNSLQKKLDSFAISMDELQKRDEKIYRVLFETSPNEIKGGSGGINKYSNLSTENEKELIINTSKKLNDLLIRAKIQDKSYEELFELAKNRQKMLFSVPAIQPISNKDMVISSGFGYRIHPIYKIKKFHYGLDFIAKTGTPIHSTGDGYVTEAYKSIDFGNVVEIYHGNGYSTLYAHMNKFKVVPGQKIKRGQIIGFVGNTGLSTGPHLHYEVHKDGQAQNPKYYIFMNMTPEEYQNMLTASENIEQSLD